MLLGLMVLTNHCYWVKGLPRMQCFLEDFEVVNEDCPLRKPGGKEEDGKTDFQLQHQALGACRGG